ncbi:hypothetical protein, partial [Bifidobacterium actinocoloniiforme]|uniref:hypothetical protein n=1 Tax=Bifidobacterium actinocoloniiforme TaxID=638619 RepID=UPI0019D3B452
NTLLSSQTTVALAQKRKPRSGIHRAKRQEINLPKNAEKRKPLTFTSAQNTVIPAMNRRVDLPIPDDFKALSHPGTFDHMTKNLRARRVEHGKTGT